MRRVVIVCVVVCALLAVGCVDEGTTPKTELTQLLPQNDLPEGLTLLAVLTPASAVSSSADVLGELDRYGEKKDTIPPIVDSAEGVYSSGGKYDVSLYIAQLASSSDAQDAYFAYLNQTAFEGELSPDYKRLEVWLTHGKQITEIKDVSPENDIRFVYVWCSEDMLLIVKGNNNREQMRELSSLVVGTVSVPM